MQPRCRRRGNTAESIRHGLRIRRPTPDGLAACCPLFNTRPVSQPCIATRHNQRQQVEPSSTYAVLAWAASNIGHCRCILNLHTPDLYPFSQRIGNWINVNSVPRAVFPCLPDDGTFPSWYRWQNRILHRSSHSTSINLLPRYRQSIL